MRKEDLGIHALLNALRSLPVSERINLADTLTYDVPRNVLASRLRIGEIKSDTEDKINIARAMEVLRCTRGNVQNHITRGNLSAYRVGRSVFLDPGEVEYLRQRLLNRGNQHRPSPPPKNQG